MADLSGIKTWAQFRTSLSSASPWLLKMTAANDLALLAPHNLGSTASTRYEPMLIEEMTKDLAGLLERCLTFRREARELDIAAVKTAADYERFRALQEIEGELEELALAIDRDQTETEEDAQVASVFDGSEDHLAAGFARESRAKSKVAAASVSTSFRRRELQTQRRKVIASYEEAFHVRHTTPGNAHNFQERFERVMTLLQADMDEAYEKAIALFAGVNQIFGSNLTIPDKRDNFLDEFVLASRDLSQFLEIQALEDVGYDLVVPLVQPFFPDGSSILSQDQLDMAIDGVSDSAFVPLSFDLTQVFEGYDRVRLRGIGLSFGNYPELGTNSSGAPLDPSRLERLSSFRLRARVRTPEQLHAVTGKPYFRPPVFFGDVGVFGGSAPLSFCQTPNVWNLNPRGIWKLTIDPYAVFATHQEVLIRSSPNRKLIYDLKLHLRVMQKAQS